MSIEQLQEFLTTNATGIQIPEQQGDLYTRYFIETTGFNWDWTLCQTVYDLQELIENADTGEFDDDECEAEMKIRSIGMSENQFNTVRVFLEDREWEEFKEK